MTWVAGVTANSRAEVSVLISERVASRQAIYDHRGDGPQLAWTALEHLGLPVRSRLCPDSNRQGPRRGLEGNLRWIPEAAGGEEGRMVQAVRRSRRLRRICRRQTPGGRRPVISRLAQRHAAGGVGGRPA